MRILLIHNKYKEAGGEDVVFEAEADLLSNNRSVVDVIVFDNASIKTVFDRLLSGLRVIYNPSSARILKQKILEFQPDVIHVHNFVPLASPSIFFVAAKFRIPVIVTLHNYRLICPSATLFHNNSIYENSIHSVFPIDAILKGVYRNSRVQTAAVVIMTSLHRMIGTWKHKVDHYIALTQFAKQKFSTAAIGIPENKLSVKPNFSVDHGMGDDVRKDFFLFVGRLTEEKGIRTLLNAARLASFNLIIIGDGPLRGLISDVAMENPNVRYLGFQKKAFVIERMKMCKGLIFPSLWYEGFPMTIVEALSTGTVVIASKLGGMAEIIQHGVNGLHFEAGREPDLISRIKEIDSGSWNLKSMQARARLTYLDHYTPERNHSLMMDIYNRARALKNFPKKTAEEDSLYQPDSLYPGFPAKKQNVMKSL
jgi:glycosyltransferase involved in cell wall biosynthesis